MTRWPIQSLRWRVQSYYGLLLVMVLICFGGMVYELQETSESQHRDAELQLRASALLGNIANQPPPQGPRADDGDDDNGPGFPPPEAGDRRPPRPGSFRLRPELAALFAAHGDRTFYYRIWTRDGTVFGSSADVPADVPPPAHAGGHGLTFRDRAGMREALECTPPGECLVVGISGAALQDQLTRFGERLAGIGVAVFIFGLAGGWWLTVRATAPINVISAAATRIAAGRLSERILSDGSGSELDRLAKVLNRTFAQLEAAFAEQARFTSDAAHELRTPVAVILAQTQLALARPRGADEYRESIETTRRAAQRTQALIESLLTLARLDSQSEPLRCQPCDLAQITREQIDLVRPLADERGIVLRQDLEPILCAGDPERLAQICVNLLSNAVKYNQVGGEVVVSVKPVDGQAVLSVSDTGPGIGAAHLPHLFERFYRADASRNRSNGGAGLGLAICKTLAEAQGGTLAVSSVVARGSTFILQIPIYVSPNLADIL